MEPVHIFEKFKLGNIGKTWVQAVWNNEFLIFDNIDEEYSSFLLSKDMGILLRDTSKVLKQWITKNNNLEDENNDVPDISWQILLGLNVDTQSLLAILGYLMKIGHDQDTNEEYRQICLQASSLYLTLLEVPGSSVYRIFHENLYQSVLETLGFATQLHLPKKKSNRTLDIENLYSNDADINQISHNEKFTLTKGLNAVIYDLILLLKSSWNFRQYERSLESTIDTLVQITRLGNEGSSGSVRFSAGLVSSLSQNAYAALRELCQDRHGSTEITIKLISKSMLQHFMVNYEHSSVKMLGVVRETSIQFLQTLLQDFGENAKVSILVLIHRLMINCPERLEARQKQAAIIVSLINITGILPNFLKIIIDDLILFSHQNKISHRIFAQEIIRRYLITSEENSEDQHENEDSSEKLKIKKILLATVLTRCIDVSSMVRGRALAIIKEYTDSPSNCFVKELFTSTDTHRLSATLEELRKSLEDDSNVFPSTDVLISILKIRAEDERALVRRSAMQIFENAVNVNPEILETAVKIISKHCRDSAMTVRRCSIQVLTTLLENNPDFPDFHRIWVKSVVPQVFDTEVSVQEKTLEVLQMLIINRILSNSSTLKNNEDLTWTIVNELSSLKMRKHLTKACDTWSRNGALTNNLISKIKLEIGSENNQAAWILLSSISEVQTIPRMEEYYTNSKKMLRGKDFVDHLSLEVLRSSLLKLDNNLIKKIRTEFYEDLCEFQVHPGVISITLDIVHSLNTAHQFLKDIENNDDIQSMMTELMSRSEKIVEKMIDNLMQMDDDDDLYLRAISTLGHSSFLCTAKISLPVLRILQGILIDCDTMPDIIKNRKDLQAVTVVVLGQQAMRDQSIAHEMMPIFRQLLCNSPEKNSDSNFIAAVRVNAAKALVDVCTRFTSLVEPFLPDMCVTMKDSEHTVREAIVVLFIELLVEDFVKVKGAFFFHILTMLTDEDEIIRDMTIFLVKERLLMKNKNLITTQFLDAIFHYNCVQFGNKCCERKMRANEKKVLTLPGQENEEKRRFIYAFLLDNVEPIGKLKILERLNAIIEGIICGVTLNVKKNKDKCALKDILWIVSKDWNQTSGAGSRADAAGEEEEVVTTSNAGIIGEKLKKHGMMVLLPTLHKLRKKVCRFSDELGSDVSRAFVRIAENFNRDQLTAVYVEFPELEDEMQRNVRLHGKDGQIDETLDDNTFQPICESTPRVSRSPTLRNVDMQPKIVLTRLSPSVSPNPTSSSSVSPDTSTSTSPNPQVILADRSSTPKISGLNTFDTPKSSKTGLKSRQISKKRRS